MNKDKHINIPNESLKHYTGLIRKLQVNNTVLSKRVKNLEIQLAKLSSTKNVTDGLSGKVSNSAIGGEVTDGVVGSGGGGYSSAQIKELVSGWISSGSLPISSHDHTSDSKGGDAYANKGAALQ